MLASVRSATLTGVDGHVVTVEVHVSTGLPSYHVVGLPDAAVRESRERVRAALLSSDLEFPQQRITVNLAPGGVRKTGAGFELAVALGLIAATGQLADGVLDEVGVLGELGLDGSVRPVPGVLALVDALRAAGTCSVIVPATDVAEASLVHGVEVRSARSVAELRACLKGEAEWPEPPPIPAPESRAPDLDDEPVDLADVRGLPRATSTRGRRCRRTSRAAHRTAGHRKDDARPPAADHLVVPRCRRGARGHPHPFRRRPCSAARPGARASLPGAASHGVDRRPRRRRLEPPPPGRGDAGTSRDVVSRRVG